MTTKKRPELDPKKAADYFAKTSPSIPEQPESEKANPIGVALTREEQDRLTDMAQELGVSRHALLLYAIRAFIRSWEAGERPKKRKKTIEELEF